ncbi:MAG: response regulator [Verrucomicrobia bacterium]|nr:response regulator [Verrucomicrobiota bacterium]
MKNPSISQVNPRSPATCRPLRVLLVEDSELDAGLVIRELERADYQPSWQRVATAPDMAAALKQERWDLVISDYMMPGFGGLEALALAQGTGLDLPFILISGTIGEDLAVEAMRAGAHDYLLKDRLTRLGPAIARELKDVQSRRERRQVEDQLRLESAALNAAANGIVITDRDGTILAVNPAWTAMTGYAAEEALGRNPRILKSGVQDAAFYRNLWETILGGRVWRG